VIVTHNSAGCIGRCLDALAEMAPSARVVVIDNASTDGTLEEVRARKVAATIVANRENRGFAAGVNQGVGAEKPVQPPISPRAGEKGDSPGFSAKPGEIGDSPGFSAKPGEIGDSPGFSARGFSEYYLLLNPDVYLSTKLDPLMGHGLAAGRLTDKTGKTQEGFTIRRFPTPLTLWFELLGLNRMWPSNPVNRRYRYLDRDLDTGSVVEQPAGAFLMFRKDVWERLGGFDEGFQPIWFEDVDFCLRASRLGYEPYYEPKVAAEHVGGHSIFRIGVGCRQWYWCASLLRYAAKHFPSVAYRGICVAVLLTSVPRAVAGMIQERSLSPILSCSKIIGLAGGRLVSRRGASDGPGRFS
jgi:N-acetylglucosaminyl-diphospho-decaprenol L-rhamnosyltransferase